MTRRARLPLSRLPLVLLALPAAAAAPALAQPDPPWPRPPFTATLSNVAPLAFGMSEAETAAALGAPLHYVGGRPGHEVFLAARPGGSGYFPRDDRLYLQFRKGRLSGSKGDWGRRWMW